MHSLLATLKGISPAKVLFWSGAGTSWAAPTCLPLGSGFTRLAVDHFTHPGTWDVLTKIYFDRAAISDTSGVTKTAPRLEAVLDSCVSVIGTRALEILAPTSSAPTNAFHAFFGEHVRRGGVHLTVNFDDCVERCAGGAGVGTVVHVHGKYSPLDLATLGARISSVAGGLSASLSATLLGELRRASAIIILGYSGSDVFDVTPFFESLPLRGADLAHLDVIWHQHVGGIPPRAVTATPRPGHSMLDGLKGTGARIHQYEGDTQQLVESLAREWGFATLAFSTHPCAALSAPLPHITDVERSLLTAHLFVTMGIGKEVLRLEGELQALASGATPAQRALVWFCLNDGWRNVGGYSKALRYARLLPAYDMLTTSVRHHRMAGDRWLRGDHHLALWHFTAAERALCREVIARGGSRSSASYDIERELLKLEITRLHWLRDLSRIPLVGTLVRRHFALPRLRRLLNRHHLLRDSPHDTAKIVRLHRELEADRIGLSLPPDLQSIVGEPRLSLHETDSFIGAINFLRRDLVEQAHRGRPPTRGELDHLLNLAELIGDRPGSVKARLLRHAYLGESWPDIWPVVRRVEWNALMKWGLLWSWLWRTTWS